MYKLIAFILLSLAVLCLSHESQTANNVPLAPMQQTAHGNNLRNIQVIKDIKVFIQQNPHLRLIRLNKNAPENHPTKPIKYFLGSRVSGDQMVWQTADAYFYPAVKNVSIQVTYPEEGFGSIVTAVEIHCLQDNGNGNAYVVAGGIEQRFISIVLQATQTERFSYNVHIFGKN